MKSAGSTGYPHTLYGRVSVWLAAAEDEDCACGKRVEEPLGEDGQREERLKAADGEQKKRAQDRLQDQRG